MPVLLKRIRDEVRSLVCLLAASTQFYDWIPDADAENGSRAMTLDEWAAKVIARRDALLRAVRSRG